MLNQDSTAKLLNLEEVIVTNVENVGDELHICIELPEVLSIDEFKGNAGGQKYPSILADPQNRKVIDILPNRYESALQGSGKSMFPKSCYCS